MSGLYELYYQPLEVNLRFKVLPADAAFSFSLKNEALEPVDYRVLVLRSFVYDFTSDVLPMVVETVDEADVNNVLDGLYRVCISLNPGIDQEEWLKIMDAGRQSAQMASSGTSIVPVEPQPKKARQTRATKIKLDQHLDLEQFLRERVIGQDEAIDAVVAAMKRKFAGLNDGNKPLASFLFAGPSGVGKTMLARSLHEYLVDGQYDLVRIDCGEYQQKHDSQKLIGAPPGYLGYDDGGQLTNRMINNPDSVVLFDEIEKAHPDFMNTLLRVLDEGVLTDGQGRRAMFNRAIIIMTTNLGNEEISKDLNSRGVGFGGQIFKTASYSDLPARESVVARTSQAIKDRFKPEIQNRIGRTVIFNYLTDDNLRKIAENELAEVAAKLATKNYRTVWEPSVIDYMIQVASNPIFGARAIARMRVDDIEDKLASLLLSSTYPKGTVFQIVCEDDQLHVTTQKPKTRRVSNGDHGKTRRESSQSS